MDWLTLILYSVYSFKFHFTALCYFKFMHSSTHSRYLLLYGYLFEGCYFGAIMGSAKIKIKNTSYPAMPA